MPSTVPPRGSVPRIDSTVSVDGAAFTDPVPRVEESDHLVAVDPLADADRGPDHGVEAWAVTTTGQDSYAHASDRTLPQPPLARTATPADRQPGPRPHRADRPVHSPSVTDTLRDRPRRGHHRRALAGRSSPTGATSIAELSRSSPSTSPSPAGSSTTPPRSGRRCCARCARSSPASMLPSEPTTSPRSASPTSARRCSPGTDRPASRTARRSSGRTAGRRNAATSSTAAGAPAARARTHRPRARPVLLRHEDRVAPHRTRHPDRRRPGDRHDRLVADLEPHRRRRVRHRCHQRQPHDVVRHPQPAVGSRIVRPAPRADRLPSRDRAVERAHRRDGRPRRGSGRHPDQRGGRRPAGRAVRSGVRRTGDGEEHLRHGFVRPAQRRRDVSATGRRDADHRGVDAGRRHDALRAGGLDLRHRLGHPVAARRPRDSSTMRPRPDRSPRSVDDSGGVFVVPAFTGLGSPWWDPYARGTIVGITRGAGRAHLTRAVSSRWRSRRATWSTPWWLPAAPSSPTCASTAGRRRWICCVRSRPINSE